MCLFITHVNSFWFIILEKHIAYCILVLASGFTSPEVHPVFQQKSAGDKFVSVLVCLKKKNLQSSLLFYNFIFYRALLRVYSGWGAT